MKKRITYFLIVVLAVCGFTSTYSCTSGRQQQLEAAIKAMNEEYPMTIDEATTLQSIALQDSDVAITFHIKEDMMAAPLKQEDMPQWRAPFITLFGTMVHDNSSIDQLFRLINDTNHTLSVQLTTVPSYKTYTISLSHEDIRKVLKVNQLPVKE